MRLLAKVLGRGIESSSRLGTGDGLPVLLALATESPVVPRSTSPLSLPAPLPQHFSWFTVQMRLPPLSNLLAWKLLGPGPWLNFPVCGLPLGDASTSVSPQPDNPVAGPGRERGTSRASILGKSRNTTNRGESLSSWTQRSLAASL